jgi:hypothetical protein
VGGFSSSLVRVVDISDPKVAQGVVGVVAFQGTDYALQFVVPGTGLRILLAFARNQVKSVAAMEANLPSRWYQVGWGTDLVQLLFNGESLTLGEAVSGAKGAVSDQDVRRTWILFGDPTTRLK